MSRSVNMVILIGNVGNYPEVGEIPKSGSRFARFNIATTRSWHDSKNSSIEKKIETEWHKVVTYTPNIVKIIENYIKKGSKVYLRGRIKSNIWDDKDGNKRSEKIIIIDPFDGDIVLLDKNDKSILNTESKNDDSYDKEIFSSKEDFSDSDDIF